MRNDTARWDAPGSIDHASPDLTITAVNLTGQHWISGLDVQSRYADRLVSWPEMVTTDRYALSLRRDRVLVVGETDLALGYSDQTGLAATDVSDAWQVADISGPKAFAHLCRGAELDLGQTSRSVMRRMFGMDVMLYRIQEATRFRVHVERARSQAFFANLKTAKSE